MSAKPDKLARMGIVHTAPTGGNDEVAEMMRLVDRLMTALLLSRREGNKFGDEDAAVQTRAAIEAHLTQMAEEAAQAAYAECARLGWKTPALGLEPVAWIEQEIVTGDCDPDSVTCERQTVNADGWQWIPLYFPVQPTEPK